jgi:hypothetical protein
MRRPVRLRSCSAWATTLMLGATLVGPLGSGSGAHADSTVPLTVNGQPSAKPALTIGGETYIPLSALSKVGVQASRSGGALHLHIGSVEGGANQLAGVEGKAGAWLFDSVWRLQAGKPEPLRKPFSGDPGTPGWGVGLEIRNGSKASVSLAGMGVGVPTLALADGSILRADEGDWQEICFTEVLPGAALKHVVKFWFAYGTTDAQVLAAQRLIVPVETDPKKLSQGYKGVRYSTPDATFRVDLR